MLPGRWPDILGEVAVEDERLYFSDKVGRY